MRSTERPSRRPSNLLALIAVNAVLLGLLAVVTLAPTAEAQGAPM